MVDGQTQCEYVVQEIRAAAMKQGSGSDAPEASAQNQA
jgi:hypothetical protein